MGALRGTFADDKCTFAWCVGPEEPTSDEDADGYIKPKHGRLGQGKPHDCVSQSPLGHMLMARAFALRRDGTLKIAPWAQ